MSAFGNRAARRLAIAGERRALRSGKWGEWRDRHPTPKEAGVGSGWLREMDRAWSNDAFAVLARTVQTEWGTVEHLAIRNVSNTDISWADKQRIKDELFSTDRLAVEVFPPASELVDGANMYHLWVLPAGFRLPFTIKRETAA